MVQRQHWGGKRTTVLLILSGFPGDQRKRLWDKLHCFAGRTLGNKVTKAKWSSVLDTEVSSESSHALCLGGTTLQMSMKRQKRKYFWLFSISFFQKTLMMVWTKAQSWPVAALSSPYLWVFTTILCISGPIMPRFAINLRTTILLPPSDVFLFCAWAPPVTSFPFHPVLRLVRYEVTSGQTMVRSGALYWLVPKLHTGFDSRCKCDSLLKMILNSFLTVQYQSGVRL